MQTEAYSSVKVTAFKISSRKNELILHKDFIIRNVKKYSHINTRIGDRF